MNNFLQNYRKNKIQSENIDPPLAGAVSWYTPSWGPGRRSVRPVWGRRLGPSPWWGPGRSPKRAKASFFGFGTDSGRTATGKAPNSALRPAFGRPEGPFRYVPGSCPANTRPGRPIYGPEALLHNIESLPQKKPDLQRASCFPITFFQWRPEQP